MIEQAEIDRVQNSVNIVDTIGAYVTLKKNGANHAGLCPFHNEKSPSFTVSETKQFYHCFGCGAHGTVITFLMEFSGLEFIDALKSIDSSIQVMPTEKVRRNLSAVKTASSGRVPHNNKQDPEKANHILKLCTVDRVSGIDFLRHKSGFYLGCYTADAELVNAAMFKHGETMRFCAAGITYGAFTPIRMNGSDNYICCTTLADGRFIANETNQNVAVCWEDANLKYVIWNKSGLNIRPCLTAKDDNYLTFEMPHLWLEDFKVTKRERVDV
jgi:hypothetical protein